MQTISMLELKILFSKISSKGAKTKNHKNLNADIDPRGER